MSDRPEIVTVEIRVGLQNGNASLSERFEVASDSLDATLAILTRFHQLAEQLRDEQAGLPRRVRGVGACLSSKPEPGGG